MTRSLLMLLAAYLVALAGCAQNPTDTKQGEVRDVDEILTETLASEDYVDSVRCLSETQIRNFQVLDDRHIVFEGRRGKYWINTLRSRCPELRRADALRTRPVLGFNRTCSLDSFQPTEWFDWPWYRRSPWAWGSSWGTGANCHFGEFQPVTEEQLGAIKAALRVGP